MLTRLSWFLLAAATVGACGQSPVAEPARVVWFEDVTSHVALQHFPDAKPADPYFMPSLMGGGVAVLDYDADGHMDVFFVPGGEQGGGSASRLYRQNADGRFEDRTREAGVEIHGYGQGTAAGDVNNDGWPDLFVTAYRRVWLFINIGQGAFRDATRESGIDNPLWGTSAGWTDFDRDGWLDLVVVNYVLYNDTKLCKDNAGQPDFCGPSGFPGSVTRLFRNRGAEGGSSTGRPMFEDVTVAAGLAEAPGPGLGVLVADFDGDRWPDLFIANDGRPNHLWMNQQDGTFREEAVLRGVGYNAMGGAEANMGIAIGDVDGNGLFDLFVTHLTDETHRLWVQVERGQFSDRTARAGLASGPKSTGFGTLFADFDNDGIEDLVLVNGRVSRPGQLPPMEAGLPVWLPYRERNGLLRGAVGGTFTDISAANPALAGTPGVHRAVAVADFDSDGGLDLVVTRLDGAATLLRNVAEERGHWVMVRVVDPELRRDAYGAELTVIASGRQWKRWMNPAYSYLSSNDPRAHVGLGAFAEVDEFRVVWPDGLEESFAGGPAGRVVTLTRGQGRSISPDEAR